MEKNTKTKTKKNSAFQNLLPHIFTMEYFRTYFKRIQDATVQGYNSCFFYFWTLVMWPTFQQPIAWTLTGTIILILFFFTFWSNWVRFHFWGICLRPWHGLWKQPPIVHTWYVLSLYYLWFLWFCFSFEIPDIPFLDIYPGHCQYQPTILTTIPVFFFHDFFSIFSLFSIQNCRCFYI